MNEEGVGQDNDITRLTIDRVDGSITYEEFFKKYLLPNVPCLIGPDLIKDWPAFALWNDVSQGSGEGTEGLHASFAQLVTLYASHKVPVVIHKSDGEIERREDVPLEEAIEQMRRAKQEESRCTLYVKDWHLVRQECRKAQEDGRPPVLPYRTPHLFADDWMNANLDDVDDDDFRFCYAGSAGSKTNLHRDVYTSYSWSANVVGSKRWRLFPPHCARYMRKYVDSETSELATDIDLMQSWLELGKLGHCVKGKAGWPDWEKAMQHCHEVIQKPGETIFVPSGWYHDVVNLTDCISLNHNWCNSVNVASMYESMCNEVAQVEEALDDVRKMMKEAANSESDDWQLEWTETVQKVAATNAGWAWHGFWSMVERSLERHACGVSSDKVWIYQGKT